MGKQQTYRDSTAFNGYLYPPVHAADPSENRTGFFYAFMLDGVFTKLVWDMMVSEEPGKEELLTNLKGDCCREW